MHFSNSLSDQPISRESMKEYVMCGKYYLHLVIFPYRSLYIKLKIRFLTSFLFPYIKTNTTTYYIDGLEANTGYKFRVMALKMDKSSSFSEWSRNVNTTGKRKFDALTLLKIHRNVSYNYAKPSRMKT